MHALRFVFVLSVVGLLQSAGALTLSTITKTIFEYPPARRDETVVDDYHGTKIVDPYRWLEDPDSDETKAFVEAQNNITQPYIDACPVKGDINERLTELWNFQKYSSPARRGDIYYFLSNTGLQNQDVLYVQDSLESEPRVFLDPNTLSEDGTIALSKSSFTEDGSTLAYGLSANGSDWITVHFKDVATGENYPEVLENVKFTLLTWTKDNKGLFYSGYPKPTSKADGSETDLNHDHKLYYHRLNTPQSEDVLVVEIPQEPLWKINAEVSECGLYLIVYVTKHFSKNMVFFVDLYKHPELNGPLPFKQLVYDFEATYEYVTNEGPMFIFRTNKGAPNYRLVKIDLNNPAEENWETLVPDHPKDVMVWTTAVDNDKLVIHYIRDVKSVLQLHSMNSGDCLQVFDLDAGSIVDYSGKKDQSELFYRFTSFLTPSTIYHVDFKKKPYKPTIYREVKVKNFDASQYEAKQIFYTSKDGTKVPMFIMSKKHLWRDGSNPTLIYGYGGFSVNLVPSFSVTRLVFMQHFNGVVAIPNIRGGGEYGEPWYDGGRLLNKQNSFDDFQAAAEYLIQERYTQPALVTIQGASNGGLLVAACINQRPELYGAAIVQVGVLDMLRFHKFTIGHAWVPDYGSSDNKTQFEYLLKYSPLHNVVPPGAGRGEYPATLVLTADHDDRVVPLHSLKFVAQLQHVAGAAPQQSRPLLARIETKAGHGGGKPTAKTIEDEADILSFMTQALGLKFVK